MTILLPIKKEYVDRIFDETKKYEYRKVKCKKMVDKIIIYETSPTKKVVGEVIIEDILYDKKEIIWNETKDYSGIEKNKYDKYLKNKEYAVAYKLGKVKKYKNVKTLKEIGINYTPQSYVYMEE